MLNFFKNIFLFSLGFFPRIKPVCFIVLFCLIFSKTSFTQLNLVYNGDFEEYSSCPEYESSNNQFPYEIEKCLGWKAPTYGTSDYFNTCSLNTNVWIPLNSGGYQLAYSGNSYLGLACQFRTGLGSDGYAGPMWWEYIQGILIKPLVSGQTYKFSMKVSLAEYSDLMIDELGVHFSDNSISSPNTAALSVQPQCVFNNPNYYTDTVNWIILESLFIASGNEQFVTIGNFKNNLTTDTLRRYNYEPMIINPYVSYFYIDDVQLIEIPFEVNLTNVFSPNGDGINDFLEFPNIGALNQKVTIINRWGNLIFESSLKNFSWDGKDFNGKEVVEGTYFFTISDINKSGFIQLIR